MILDWLTKIKDILSLSPKQLFILAFISWAVVLLPKSILGVLNIHELREQYVSYLGTFALISSLWLLSLVIYNYYDKIKMRNAQLYLLKNLSPKEQLYLSHYVDNNNTTQQFRINNGIVMGLKSKHILYIPSHISKHDTYFDFNIQPWAFEELKKRPNLLEQGRGLKNNNVGTDDTCFRW